MEEQTKENVETKEEVVEKNFFKRMWAEAKDFGAFISENPKYLFTIAAQAAGAVGLILKAADILGSNGGGRNKCDVPDEVTGLNYRTSHPLTNAEIMELSDRMVDGETTGEALMNMGVLKEEKKRK